MMSSTGNIMQTKFFLSIVLAATLVLSACGQRETTTDLSPSEETRNAGGQAAGAGRADSERGQVSESIFNLFRPPAQETTVKVNRYIWSATLEVLNFLPIQTVDPFTGVIVTGFGTPPGGGRAYRATVLIDDPALDARSLNVALQSRGGTASKATVRAIEDAILTRARQLRQIDSRL